MGKWKSHNLSQQLKYICAPLVLHTHLLVLNLNHKTTCLSLYAQIALSFFKTLDIWLSINDLLQTRVNSFKKPNEFEDTLHRAVGNYKLTLELFWREIY